MASIAANFKRIVNYLQPGTIGAEDNPTVDAVTSLYADQVEAGLTTSSGFEGYLTGNV